MSSLWHWNFEMGNKFVLSWATEYLGTGTSTKINQTIYLTWLDNKVHKLVKVLHMSLLNTTVVAFKVLPLGRYALMPVPSPPFKTILELVLWNGLLSCHCITPDVIKMPFNISFIFGNRKKSLGARPGE